MKRKPKTSQLKRRRRSGARAASIADDHVLAPGADEVEAPGDPRSESSHAVYCDNEVLAALRLRCAPWGFDEAGILANGDSAASPPDGISIQARASPALGEQPMDGLVLVLFAG